MVFLENIEQGRFYFNYSYHSIPFRLNCLTQEITLK